MSKIPGFTAETSLCQTSRRYQMGWTLGQAGEAIYPAQSSDCFGSVAPCPANFCIGLKGGEHGLCWNVCKQPSVCEPSCRWHVERGSFSRFRYKHLPGPPGAWIGCYQDCTGWGPLDIETANL